MLFLSLGILSWFDVVSVDPEELTVNVRSWSWTSKTGPAASAPGPLMEKVLLIQRVKKMSGSDRAWKVKKKRSGKSKAIIDQVTTFLLKPLFLFYFNPQWTGNHKFTVNPQNELHHWPTCGATFQITAKHYGQLSHQHAMLLLNFVPHTSEVIL